MLSKIPLKINSFWRTPSPPLIIDYIISFYQKLICHESRSLMEHALAFWRQTPPAGHPPMANMGPTEHPTYDFAR